MATHHLGRDLLGYLTADGMMRAAGLDPDPWQVGYLRSQSRRILLNVHRQSGKTTTTSFKALHHAISGRRRLVLVVSPGIRQSGILFEKVREAYRVIESAFPARKITELQLHLDNGSRIISLPGKEQTIRGYSGPTLIIIDEAARVPDALYYALRPMLATSNGQLIAMSTPWGRRGFFFTAWHSSESWERYRLTADENPRISQAFLAEERVAFGEWWYAQEYGCEFRDADEQFFSSAAIERLFDDAGVAPLFQTERLPGRVLQPDELQPLWRDD